VYFVGSTGGGFAKRREQKEAFFLGVLEIWQKGREEDGGRLERGWRQRTFACVARFDEERRGERNTVSQFLAPPLRERRREPSWICSRKAGGGRRLIWKAR
jgi:hypothetical protein